MILALLNQSVNLVTVRVKYFLTDRTALIIFISDQVFLKIDLKRKTVPEVLGSIHSRKDILMYFLILLITGKM